MQKGSTHPLHDRRRAGILLHPTSLPGPAPKGIIGHDAYRFVDFLQGCGITVWQMLPLGPTHGDGSPYQCLSTHAAETDLISLDWLSDRGLLDTVADQYDFEYHNACLHRAHQSFINDTSSPICKDYQKFITQQADWLDDYALFMALREVHQGQVWTEWETPLRKRHKQAISKAHQEHAELIEYHRFCQFVFFQQWHELREYANQRNILIFGDLPIYVSLDSADVWANPKLFSLDKDGQPKLVAGVPPDYFSETGQRWGNPQYNWPTIEKDDFSWWQARFKTQLALFDVLRVDHFRGFQAYWEIKAEEETAINGRWVEAPGEALLKRLNKAFKNLPLVAEDLGIITEEVDALRQAFSLPGMKVLQFAFDFNPHNPYLPHNHEYNAVAYTGTHDNDTTLSWYQQLPEHNQHYVYNYLNASTADHMPWPLIRTALASVCCLAVMPMQDILGLGEAHRMNTPGTTEGNWQWRFDWTQVHEQLDTDIKQLLQLYDRLMD